MNIAILIPELEGGGAERVASLIGNYYSDNGYNVFYFLAKGKKKIVYEVRGKIINTEIQINDDNPVFLLAASLIMRKYKMKYDINVSISFMEQFNYINILSKGRDLVITRICTILSQRVDLQQSYLYNNNIIKYMYNHADKVVVMTNYAVREMITVYGINRKKLIKIPNPIRSDEGHYDECADWNYGDNTVICVGRLENVKQHNVAVRVFSKVIKSVPDAKMVILGVGPNESRLKALVRNLKLESNVCFIGFKKNVNYYLDYSKVFLMTSRTEGFPNSMLEAMSRGVPVVSIDSPGAPREILKGKIRDYGIVTPYIKHDLWENEAITDDEIKLSEAVVALLSDEKLYNEYSKASYERSRSFDFNKIMDKWNMIVENKNKI